MTRREMLLSGAGALAVIHHGLFEFHKEFEAPGV